MDDIASKLTAFLEDDSKVEMLKGLTGLTGKPLTESGGGGGIDPAAIGVLSKLAGADDDRVRLIKALRPFVSEKRGASIDEIARLLKLGELVMLFFEQGKGKENKL